MAVRKSKASQPAGSAVATRRARTSTTAPAPAAAPAPQVAASSPKVTAPAPSTASPRTTITHEMIARRAYQIWQSGRGGSDWENWAQAERELRGAR